MHRLGRESIVLLEDEPVGLRFTHLICLIPCSFIRRWLIQFTLHVSVPSCVPSSSVKKKKTQGNVAESKTAEKQV